MPNGQPLSRRGALKLMFASAVTAVISACKPPPDASAPTPTSFPAVTPTPTLTSTPTPTPNPNDTSTPIATVTPTSASTNTPSPTDTPEATSTPTNTPVLCFALISPEDGTSLPEIGRVSFTWETQVGATNYRLEIIAPDDNLLTYETTNTSFDLYLDTLPGGGAFNWQVIAFNAQGDEVCTAGSYIFTKPQLEPAGSGQVGDTMAVYHGGVLQDDVAVYDEGALPWIDLLVRLDDVWYGPEREPDDEINALPLPEGYHWECDGGFGCNPNGEVWYVGPATEGKARLFAPDGEVLAELSLQVMFQRSGGGSGGDSGGDGGGGGGSSSGGGGSWSSGGAQ